MPSAWLDDTLIAERKAGLSAYLAGLLDSPQFRVHKFVIDFLTPSTTATPSGKLSMEDALPSTLTRKAALEAQSLVSVEATPVAAAYYPDWSSDTNPPASLDFSKFDIILFGTSAHSPPGAVFLFYHRCALPCGSEARTFALSCGSYLDPGLDPGGPTSPRPTSCAA